MRTVDCEQGSKEWLLARVGIPTASEFKRLITPGKWEPSKSDTRHNYAIELLTEIITGFPLDSFTGAAMDHGKDWEPKARAAYEMICGKDVEICQFYTNDEGTIGASPDGFVGEDGAVEIKCPEKREIHVGNMVDKLQYDLMPEDWTRTVEAKNLSGFAQDHWIQTQGQLYITGRKWADLISYFGGLPMVMVRIYPNSVFQEKLHKSLMEFCELLDGLVAKAKAADWITEKTEKPEQEPNIMGITMEEVEDFIASKYPKVQNEAN